MPDCIVAAGNTRHLLESSIIVRSMKNYTNIKKKIYIYIYIYTHNFCHKYINSATTHKSCVLFCGPSSIVVLGADLPP